MSCIRFASQYLKLTLHAMTLDCIAPNLDYARSLLNAIFHWAAIDVSESFIWLRLDKVMFGLYCLRNVLRFIRSSTFHFVGHQYVSFCSVMPLSIVRFSIAHPWHWITRNGAGAVVGVSGRGKDACLHLLILLLQGNKYGRWSA